MKASSRFENACTEEGVVFDIQRYSIHDGPGIRTIVFLKGCPLACRWCSNPESQNLQPELMYAAPSCLRCGTCIQACPERALSFANPAFVDRERCTQCGVCAQQCDSGALTMKGRRMTVEQVVQVLAKDAVHYRRSGGGITLSGGEPLGQPDFAFALLRACGDRGWSTAMETTGMAPTKVVERLMPLVDLALVDLKHLDSSAHQHHTGVHNTKILENAQRIAELTRTVVRVPIIPGVNADEASLEAIARFARRLHGVDTLHILPYHTYGQNKYGLLGREYPLGAAAPLPQERVDALKAVVENCGLHCVIGG